MIKMFVGKLVEIIVFLLNEINRTSNFTLSHYTYTCGTYTLTYTFTYSTWQVCISASSFILKFPTLARGPDKGMRCVVPH